MDQPRQSGMARIPSRNAGERKLDGMLLDQNTTRMEGDRRRYVSATSLFKPSLLSSKLVREDTRTAAPLHVVVMRWLIHEEQVCN